MDQGGALTVFSHQQPRKRRFNVSVLLAITFGYLQDDKVCNVINSPFSLKCKVAKFTFS